MRHLLHVIVSLAMWCLFGYYWHVVLGREVGSSTLRALALLGLTVAVGLVATLLWVGHNLRLARKFSGRRRQTPSATPPRLERDTIGRGITHPGLADLRAARVVDITADTTTKSYAVGRLGDAP
jgi:hypothetical protein